MIADHRQHHLDTIRQTLSLLVYPIQYVVSRPAALSGWASENLDSRDAILEENRSLKQDQIKFRAQLQKLAALKAENNRLRELLQSSRKVGEHVLIGELLAVDLDPFSRQIVINKGSRDNIYLNQPVLDAHGIMGQIVYVSPYSSTAMLITDANHAIPVQVNRNNLRAIVEGNGSTDTMDINFLPNSADIEEGDLLTSSGLGGIYPPDYPVARVKTVVRNPSRPYAKIVVEPVAQLEKSRQVLMVWRSERDEGEAPDVFVDQSLPFEQSQGEQDPVAAQKPKKTATQHQEQKPTAQTGATAQTSQTAPKPKPKPKPKPQAPAAAAPDQPSGDSDKPVAAGNTTAQPEEGQSDEQTKPVTQQADTPPTEQGNNNNDAQ